MDIYIYSKIKFEYKKRVLRRGKSIILYKISDILYGDIE